MIRNVKLKYEKNAIRGRWQCTVGSRWSLEGSDVTQHLRFKNIRTVVKTSAVGVPRKKAFMFFERYFKEHERFLPVLLVANFLFCEKQVRNFGGVLNSLFSRVCISYHCWASPWLED